MTLNCPERNNMRESVERRRRLEAKRKQNRRDANIVLVCGLLSLPLSVAMFFLPACDNMMAYLMLFQSVMLIAFSNYIRNYNN